MARLFPLDTGDPGDSGDSCHGDGSGTPSSVGTPCERGESKRRAQAIVAGSCAQHGGESASPSTDAVHDSTPLQSLPSRPWRPGGRVVDHSSVSNKDPKSSPTLHLHSIPSVSSGEGGNPSESSRFVGREERKVRLPHEVLIWARSFISGSIVLRLWFVG